MVSDRNEHNEHDELKHPAQGAGAQRQPSKPAHRRELRGLSDAEVEERRHRWGANTLTPPPRTPWWKQLLEKFDDPIIRVLMVAAVVAIGVGTVDGSYVEGIGIVIAILLATGLSFLNEYRAAQEFEILNQSNEEIAVKVIRNGAFTSVPRKELVKDDLVLLELGEEVPADGVLIEAVSLRINESRLTGESAPVKKTVGASGGQAQQEWTSETPASVDHDRAYAPEVVLRGTTVMDGHGLFRVTAVGDHTELGQTARAAAAEDTDPTPLTRQLERLSQLIGVVAFGVAGALFVALVVRGAIIGEVHLSATQWFVMGVLFVSALTAILPVWLPVFYDGLELAGRGAPRPAWLERASLGLWGASVGGGVLLCALVLGGAVLVGRLSPQPAAWVEAAVIQEYLRYFMVAVTIIVVAVPEGLPMSVTLSLAYSMRRMAATNNLVRRMHACETIGAATVICSDKTGTLTFNQMRVGKTHFPALGKNQTVDQKEGQPLNDTAALIVAAMAANSTANLKRQKDGPSEPLGNPTEAALLLWLEQQSIDYLDVRERFHITDQLAFSSERKYMATLGTPAQTASLEDTKSTPPRSLTLHVKGAPEVLLEKCNDLWGAEGLEDILTHKDAIKEQMEEAQSRGMRTLGFAFRKTQKPAPKTPDASAAAEEADDLSALTHDLTWLGFVAIADPVRPEVPDSIRRCRHAGIGVKVVTGDNPRTAQEIARQVGLWESTPPVDAHMSGPQFGALDHDSAAARVEALQVLSRARPADKLKLVKLLKEKNEVVAVTGDGTNDGPALNMADVGLAMGRTGTAVAKEASDIVLLDDSFPSIVQAVQWGRSLYLNIQRFIIFQLTINVSALGTALLGPFVGIKLPLTVPQMLWVNLIMDTFAALALATEPPVETVMEKPPRDPAEFIITRPMAVFILGVGAVFLAGLISGLFYLRTPNGQAHPSGYGLSVFFTAFVLAQFWNLFNTRVFGRGASAFNGLFQNKAFLLVSAAILLGQVLIVQFGGRVFRTVPLSFTHWLEILALTSPVLWCGEGLRFVDRLRKKR